jgi:hypothetical protein
VASLHLTKSRYMAGLQCLRRLWLLVHEPAPYEPPAAGSPMAIGQDIGRYAHLLFPGGVTIEDEPWQHTQAVARTASLMNDQSIPAIFEGAFECDGIRIRVDVLERLEEGAWGLREVKSSTGLKDHYLGDLAIQLFVLKAVGVPVRSVELVHVNSSYVRGSGDISWVDFFTRLELGDDVATRLIDLPAHLPEMRNALDGADLPYAEPGAQCGTPYGCDFWGRCTADKPTDWINYLPRLSQARLSELKALGVESISAIPADFPLTAKQTIIRDILVSGQPYVSPDLPRLLEGDKPPVCYLDFEAMMPPIPLYAGTRPYQVIPFQWSLHAIDSGGALQHREFLADGRDDPRREFAETLIEALVGFNGPVIVYSAYEQTRLNELAIEFPDLAEPINGIIARLKDLLPVVREAVYLPEFGFSNSIKSVGPALCPDFGYDDLEDIADGGAASAAFLQLASGSISLPSEADRLRRALLAYCRRDTLGLVEVHRALTVLGTTRLAAPLPLPRNASVLSKLMNVRIDLNGISRQLVTSGQSEDMEGDLVGCFPLCSALRAADIIVTNKIDQH